MPMFSKDQLTTYYKKPLEFLGSIPCVSTWFIAQIMADGEVIPYTRCYHVPLGNINEQPFLELWNGEKARAWRGDLRGTAVSRPARAAVMVLRRGSCSGSRHEPVRG
jgi:hypothetical protein